jgi:hypothetical protein
MRNPAGFYTAIGVAVLAALAAVIYLIPGITHPWLMGGPTIDPAIGMAVLLFVVAVFAAIVAILARPSTNRQ